MSSFCGIEIAYQHGGKDLTLSQHDYVKSLIDGYGNQADEQRLRHPTTSALSYTDLVVVVEEEVPVSGEKQSGNLATGATLLTHTISSRFKTPVPGGRLRFRPPIDTQGPSIFGANETGEQKLRRILNGINKAAKTLHHKVTGKPKAKVSKRAQTLTAKRHAFVALYTDFGDMKIFEKLTQEALPKLSRKPRKFADCSYPVNFLALIKLRRRRPASRLL